VGVEVWSLEKRRGFLLCIAKSRRSERMARSSSKDAQDLFRALWSAYAATPTNLKVLLFPSSFIHLISTLFFPFFPNPILLFLSDHWPLRHVRRFHRSHPGTFHYVHCICLFVLFILTFAYPSSIVWMSNLAPDQYAFYLSWWIWVIRCYWPYLLGIWKKKLEFRRSRPCSFTVF